MDGELGLPSAFLFHTMGPQRKQAGTQFYGCIPTKKWGKNSRTGTVLPPPGTNG